MQWTVAEMARALAVALPVGLDPRARLAGVSIDSRSIRPGELFIAIHGPRHDGHDFVRRAIESGALAAVVAEGRAGGYPQEIRGKLLSVGDTLAALQGLARAVRRVWGRQLAAVTGSVGKTTTKEILAALLAARFRVLKSEGNLNNEYGLPLTLLRLDDRDQAAVVELGMSHPGEIRRLTEIAEPDIGVVTRVAPVHLEFFSSLDEIALAKRELIEGLVGARTVAVLNQDDPRVRAFRSAARNRVVSYGFAETAEFRATNVEDRGAEGTVFDCVSPAGRTRLKLPLVGRHNVSNALAALAAASVWGIGVEDARQALQQLGPAGMRGEVLRFEERFAVINDSYNSNPAALAAMVELLAVTSGYRRRILVAGEMLELGPDSPAFHREAGRQSANRVDWIFGVQGDAVYLVRGAIEAGHPPAQTQFFPSSEEAAKFIAGFATRGDLLLVKGSRGVKMERVVEALVERGLANPVASRANLGVAAEPTGRKDRG